jgi:hypothetical protein
MKSVIIDFCKIASMLKLAKLNDDQFKDIQKFRAYVLDPYFPSLVEFFDKSMPEDSIFNINTHITELTAKSNNVEKFIDEDIEQFLQLEASDELSQMFMRVFMDFQFYQGVSQSLFGEDLLAENSKFKMHQIQRAKKNTSGVSYLMKDFIEDYLKLNNYDIGAVSEFISEYRSIKNLLPDFYGEEIDFKTFKVFNRALQAFFVLWNAFYKAKDKGEFQEVLEPTIERFKTAKSIRESDMFDIVYEFTKFLKENKSKTSIRNITDAFTSCVESNCDPGNAYQFLTDYIQ